MYIIIVFSSGPVGWHPASSSAGLRKPTKRLVSASPVPWQFRKGKLSGWRLENIVNEPNFALNYCLKKKNNKQPALTGESPAEMSKSSLEMDRDGSFPAIFDC